MISREYRDCKYIKGEKGVVIKGLVIVILICGMLKVCFEFFLVGGGGVSFFRYLGCENDRDFLVICEVVFLGIRGVWGFWLRGTIVLNIGSFLFEILAFLFFSGGGVEWAFFEF